VCYSQPWTGSVSPVLVASSQLKEWVNISLFFLTRKMSSRNFVSINMVYGDEGLKNPLHTAGTVNVKMSRITRR